MRILLVNPGETTAPGGINRTVRETAKHLSKRGHRVTVLQPNPLSLPAEEIYEGFKVIRVNSTFGKYFYGLSPEIYFYLKKRLRELEPEIVHVHGYHNLFSPEVAYVIKKIEQRAPIVFSFHLDIFRSTLAGKYLWRQHNFLTGKRISKLADWIIAFSSFEAALIKDSLNVLDDKICIIPHGVGLIDLSKIDRSDDTLNLLYVGYLIKRKGVHYILRSLYELVYTLGVENVKLTIVGEDFEKVKLLRLAKDYNLMSYINWLPFLPQQELIKTIKQADLLLLLSESEAYGIVVAETLALGTPVIVTKRTALKEFLNEPGCFGIDYPPDPKAVADLIIEIHRGEVKVGPFSNRIRTWDMVAEDYERLYESVVKIK